MIGWGGKICQMLLSHVQTSQIRWKLETSGDSKSDKMRLSDCVWVRHASCFTWRNPVGFDLDWNPWFRSTEWMSLVTIVLINIAYIWYSSIISNSARLLMSQICDGDSMVIHSIIAIYLWIHQLTHFAWRIFFYNHLTNDLLILVLESLSFT